MKNVRPHVSAGLVIVEAVVTTLPFLLSWWLCSLYRSVIAGWTVSGMKGNEKRAALRQMMGEHADAG